MDIEVSKSAIKFKKVCIMQAPGVPLHHPQLGVVYSTPTGSILFKQHFNKSCKTYQLTNQCYNLPNFKSDWFIESLLLSCFGPRVVTEDHNSK